MTIRSVTVVLHEGKPGARERAEKLTSRLSERGIEVGGTETDLVVSLGGDGTMLRAAQAAHTADALLLGVNLGTLGYLTEVDDEEAALDAILDGNFEIESRMMLSCRVDLGEHAPDQAGPRSYVGLNEVLVERASRHRLVRLAVRIGGETLGDFNADGVIVSTPTGSTAYALSAGGPIVSPRARCMLVVPVSAHNMFARPFVLADDETIEVIVRDSAQQAALSLDGAIGCDLPAGARVLVSRHPRALKLVRLAGPGFIERLRRRLQLPE